MTQFINLVIDTRVFLDVRIGLRDIRFRLIIVIETDKVFNRIVREKLFKFTVKLSSECFVMRHDECWTIDFFDDIGNGKCLSCPRCS